MTTEYERLLTQMIEERKRKIDELAGKKGKEKELARAMTDVRFIETELGRYQQGLSLFRTKGVPKVGRWGKPEVEGGESEAERKE
jgi:hypothetical protein